MSEDNKFKPTVMVSGGFDPVHVGHIRMILEASQYGDVIVIANTDQWLHRKKGFVFMEWERRAEILNSIKGVILVDSVDDSDGTVCEAIERLQPTYFANGGDRGKTNTPEQSVCEEIGVEMLWGVGGDYKADASSDLVERFRKHQDSEEFNEKNAGNKHSGR
ncbi:MAG: adenylyltransferase/cytidyltransferase family protein [Candidatus Hodarchaeales archaeon]|jgi:D-beta-D-heptose 7-phosphate kinase/D-beta-D-heptose 1-phosphate adenosyltransferase